MNIDETHGAKQKLSALIDFGNLINSSLNLKFILDNLLLTSFSKFLTTRGAVAVINENGVLKIESYKGLSAEAAAEFPFIRFDTEQLRTPEGYHRMALRVTEYEGDGQLNPSTQDPAFSEVFNMPLISEFMEKNGFCLAVPIASTQSLRGCLFLGERLGKKKYTGEDISFLSTIVNIASTAVENSIIVDTLKLVNRNLDSKVSMLSSLFELSKEFSGILDVQRVCKLLGFTIMGQLLVSGYSVVLCQTGEPEILESRFPVELIRQALKTCTPASVSAPLRKEDIMLQHPELAAAGTELIVPMQIHGETKGIVILGKRFNDTPYSEVDIEFVYSLVSLAIVSIENSRLFKEALEKQKMEEDLEIAREIQRNLLPKSIPSSPCFDIAAINITSRQVGGDYYDLIKLDEENLLFAVADVAGKGVSASLMMANLQAFLKIICRQGMKLDTATGIINDLVSENVMPGSFITFFWGILNCHNKQLIYVNAGHNPPLLVRDGKITKLKMGGMILGVIKTIAPYQFEEIQLRSGDMLVMFTDGVTEAMNARAEEFSDERLEDLALSIADKDANGAMNTIMNEVRAFVDGANQSDDITLMTVKVK